MTHIEREILFDSSSEVLDAITLLSEAHKELLTLFGDFDHAQSWHHKHDIVEKISSKLLTEMQIEEEIFLPAAKRVLKEKGIISAAIMDHTVLRYLLAEIKTIDVSSEIYDIKVKVLGEHVKQHIKTKQAKLFPKVSSTGKLDLWALGLQLLVRRKQLQRLP